MSALFAAFGIDWHLLLIQAVNFGVLLVVLTYFLYKPILRIIDERRDKVAEGVRTSEQAARKLEDAKKESDEMVGTASREAESMVAAARTRADEKGNEIVKQEEAKAESVLRDAQLRAEEAKRLALDESSKEIARAAMLAAEKILASK